MNANLLPPRPPLCRSSSVFLLLATLPFSLSELAYKTDLDKQGVGNAVQIGVRREMRGDTCRYVYTVLNQSKDTLTTVWIGWDADRDECELNNGPAYASPDTAYSPPGYECAPWHYKDPSRYSIGWTLVDTLVGGIPPATYISEFAVALPRCDLAFERVHWMVRFRSPLPCLAYTGALMPEGELDVPPWEGEVRRFSE